MYINYYLNKRKNFFEELVAFVVIITTQICSCPPQQNNDV